MLDISSEMARLTYSIVGRTLFSFNTGEDAATVEKAMRVILPHVFGRLGNLVNWPGWLPTPANRRFRQSLAEVDQVVYRIIARHRLAQEKGEPDTDLLAMLMRVRDSETGAGLDDSQLRNETITFLLAGHETTANALTWTFYLISRHPEVERRLLAEITTVLGGRTPVLEDVSKLSYTRKVIQESMRLYPPIWIIERRVIEEDVIGGYTLPAGSAVVISPYAMHRHPAFWERPEVFDPSRFDSPPPAAYIPFGAGPRSCIGSEFAMLEAQLITAMVMQSFQLRSGPRASGGAAAGHHPPLEVRHDDDAASESGPSSGLNKMPVLPLSHHDECCKTTDGPADPRQPHRRRRRGPRGAPDPARSNHRRHHQGRHRRRHQTCASGRGHHLAELGGLPRADRDSRNSSSAWGRIPSRATRCRRLRTN